MKRTLLLFAACLAVLFLSAYAMAGNGPGTQPDEPGQTEPNPGGPDVNKKIGKGPMGGFGKFCKDGCDEGVLWQDVCKGVCLADGCLLKKGPVPTGVWQEAFGTGGEGSAGSEISAYGKSVWSFTGAQICEGCVTPVAGRPGCYLTVYEGGTFTLNLPCVAEPLVAGGDPEGEKVTAYNYSCKNSETGLASFTIYFSGYFDEPQAPVHAEEGTPAIEFFEAVAHYAGKPEQIEPDVEPESEYPYGGQEGALDAVTLVLKGTPTEPEPVEPVE